MCMCVCLISRNRCFPHAMLRSFYLLLLIFVTMLLMMLIVSLQLTFFQFVCRGAFLVCSNGLYIYIYIYIYLGGRGDRCHRTRSCCFALGCVIVQVCVWKPCVPVLHSMLQARSTNLLLLILVCSALPNGVWMHLVLHGFHL